MLGSSAHKPFYFIRHGQSEANAQGITCGGNVDTPLTNLGRTQALRAAEIMASVSRKPSIILHSDLSRATETARIVNEVLHVPMISLSTLREHKVGAWEGLPCAETIPFWENEMDPPSGEPVADFIERATQAISGILMEYDLPLIVAHGGIWQSLPRVYDLKFDEFPENAAPYFFESLETDPLLFPWKAHVLGLCPQQKQAIPTRHAVLKSYPHPSRRIKEETPLFAEAC